MGTLDKSDVSSPQSQPQKGRTRKSGVWDHFTIKNVGGNCLRAWCNNCDKSFAYSTGPKMSGTSHLKRHIDTGLCHVTLMQDKNVPDSTELKNGTTSVLSKKRQRGANGVLAIPFSQKRCNNEIARMIVLHDYPLDMVEHPGFIEFVRTLQPEFEAVSSAAIYDECMDIYSSEKTTLANLLSGIPGRVSLSLNMWTLSDETMGYAVLSGHFIDSDWTLHRRLLNVVMVPDPESEDAFNNAVLSCLSGWGLESKLFALTLDRSFASEAAVGNLRDLLSVKNPHMLNGQFLIGSCYAHILSSLAFDAINAMSETIQKVRNCVKYVKTSELNKEKFMEIKLQLQVPSKKNLVLDNCARWDSTYHMLSAASELKEVYACFDTFDNVNVDVPSLDEWRQIETLRDYLQRFYDAANILTAQKHPTADLFFTEVCTIQLKLFISAVSEDPFVNNLIQPLIEKFERYWRDCSFVLAMAVVMDPRYKLKLVGHYFSELYGEQAESFLRAVEDGVQALYLEYVAQLMPLPSFDVGESHEGGERAISFDIGESLGGDEKSASFDIGESHEGDEKTAEAQQYLEEDTFADLDIYISEISSNNHVKSDLDQYLEDDLHISKDQDNFKVLDWWKVYNVRYPTLSKMAADLLSMPLATVPRDFVFDTVNKKVDCFRGLLKPAAIEAFACTKDWLQSGMHSATMKMES